MTLAWWEIPGPNRFVRRVENTLLDRLNVVAALPEGLGDDWFNFFRRRWRLQQEHMDIIRVSDDQQSPLENLSEAFTTNTYGASSIHALVGEPEFCGRTVGILVDGCGSWQKWKEFITAYERECRLVEIMDRTVLLIVTDAVNPARLPAPETHLRIHIYDGYAQPQDCYMYAWVLLGAGAKQTWRTELKISLCAQLAQWDPKLCERLSDCDLCEILQRESYTDLFSSAKDSMDAADLDEAWTRGVLQRRDNTVVYHSGWLAMDLDSGEFFRRIWAAQIQVIFPLIEQFRYQVVDMYRNLIYLPVRNYYNDEQINDPCELEIAMLRSILKSKSDVPRAVYRKLDQAYEFRNALAHLTPLTSTQIQEFELSLE